MASEHLQIPPLHWALFGAVLLIFLAVDLLAHRGNAEESRRSAVAWSVVWVVVGTGFAGFVWWQYGPDKAQKYLAAYLIEKSLSLDNLFVFLVIFGSLGIPRQYQRRVLSWGIFGALVFRAIFIWLGSAALERWEWVVYVFGAILLWAAIRTLKGEPEEQQESKLIAWLSRRLPVTHRLQGEQFFARVEGRWVATPLLIAVIALELTDIVFAVDSVPAAFSVARDPFLVYTSNAFAILGLRALYIVMANMLAGLKYLHYGLATVLGFAAFKIMTEKWIHIAPLLSVAIILTVLTVSVIASLRSRERRTDLPEPPP